MNDKLIPFLDFMLQEVTSQDKVKFDPNHRMGGLPELLEDEKSNPVVRSETCYICRDPDFRDYGLPLCFPCVFCGGHIAADDTICDDCGKDAMLILEGE